MRWRFLVAWGESLLYRSRARTKPRGWFSAHGVLSLEEISSMRTERGPCNTKTSRTVGVSLSLSQSLVCLAWGDGLWRGPADRNSIYMCTRDRVLTGLYLSPFVLLLSYGHVRCYHLEMHVSLLSCYLSLKWFPTMSHTYD